MAFRPSLMAVLLIVPLSGCYGLYGNDEFERYVQRKDTVTLSAGNAMQANAVTHMNNPWPRYVGDRNIPMQGTKAERAMECYRQGGGQEPIGRGAVSQTNINTGSGSASGGQSNQLRC